VMPCVCAKRSMRFSNVRSKPLPQTRWDCELLDYTFILSSLLGRVLPLGNCVFGPLPTWWVDKTSPRYQTIY
jgi:hypothetical protein